MFECPSEGIDQWQASDRNSGGTLRQTVGSMEFINALDRQTDRQQYGRALKSPDYSSTGDR